MKMSTGCHRYLNQKLDSRSHSPRGLCVPPPTASLRAAVALSHILLVFIVETLRTARPCHSLATHLWGRRPPKPGWRLGPGKGF